ncbi:FliA/WhiG family RNA polymerase sigma factor [Cellulomonas persica]|uniref:RNA polymerase sigma factor n=1 Tax=Cellulomonas persica TaxID=76861 RepID=A0A510UNR4_9CELL|nr:FliA/WhiG family RNA polymerase sigma factor [Cellulomonas persica]GEK16288.1 RNA polymerase sigma factor WhiG [Cellulomonas persica]
MMTLHLDTTPALRAVDRAGAAPAGTIPQQRGLLVAEVDDAVASSPLDAVLDDEEVELADVVVLPEVPSQRGAQSPDVAELWTAYKATGERRHRDALILHYASLVTAVAGRVGMRLPATVEQADLVSYGMFGLIDAIEKYQLDRSVKFESYASSRIRGAIIDELRAMDWVPRSVRTKARSLDRAYAELEATLHRAPTEAELAARLGVPVTELRAVCSQLSTSNLAALDELLGGEDRAGGVSLGDTLCDDRILDPAGTLADAETAHLLSRAIEQLGERERIVVVLYYYEGMTLAEIGRVLGVTESRISQMHTAAMTRLRTRLLEAERC